MRIVENKRDRRDEPAVFYAVFSFITPRVSFAIAKDILRKLAVKKPKNLKSIKLLRNHMILNRHCKAHCKGKKSPLQLRRKGLLRYSKGGCIRANLPGTESCCSNRTALPAGSQSGRSLRSGHEAKKLTETATCEADADGAYRAWRRRAWRRQ